MENERRKKKEVKKVSWWRPCDTVLFCPPTPGSELANKIKEVVNAEKVDGGFKVKVVERCGVTLKSQLPGLKSPQECRPNCIVHRERSML